MHLQLCLAMTLPLEIDKANDPYWQPWEINEDLHDCMRTYYETEEGKGDNVKVFDKGDDCQSEEE